jgi:hypothetical protein
MYIKELKYYGGILVLFIGVCLFIENKQNTKEKAAYENVSRIEVHCAVCYKDLTDDINKIPFYDGSAYYCTLCYQEAKRRVNDDLESEGNKASLSEAKSNPEYSVGSDEKVYKNAACSLCGGTGIEENHSTVSRELGEPSGRICPQCKGTGHGSY